MHPITDDSSSGARTQRSESGIVLAIVLVLIFVLITAVYTFQRRAIVDTAVAANRLKGAEAEALARGGLRIGEAIVFLDRLKKEADSVGANPEAAGNVPPIAADLLSQDDLWASVGAFPLQLEGDRELRLTIEDEGARLNLNALVPQGEDQSANSTEEAEEYLAQVLQYIIEGIDEPAGDKSYDAQTIAASLLDYIDEDEDARIGGDEDNYYRSQDPPYLPRNGPFLSFDEIGLVEGIDPRLLEAMRDYVTVHPIGGSQGINLNRAKPWVLSIVYAGTSGDRALVREQTVRDIFALRDESKLICSDSASDPVRCVVPREVGNGALGDGSIYPETALPAEPTVFRVVAEARVGAVTRRMEAIYDTRPMEGPQLLSWRRLRGSE
jgi:type II secretory pathway component PulK